MFVFCIDVDQFPDFVYWQVVEVGFGNVALKNVNKYKI